MPSASRTRRSTACRRRWRRAGRALPSWWPDIWRASRPMIVPARASMGTETSGSLLSPANQNGVVTVKPTVGLISRAGIIPLAHSQDTAGPMTRTVRDAAILLNVLAVRDSLDPATKALRRPADYTKFLDHDGLRGARIGVPSDPRDPPHDVYYGGLRPRQAEVMRAAIA